MSLPQQYRDDFDYLEGLSKRGTLQASNQIYQKLKKAGETLPEVKRALKTLNVNY